MVDSMLDGSVDKATYEEKKAEMDETQKELEYRISTYKAEMKEALDYEERIEDFRKLLMENRDLEVFDRAVFESVIDNVIIGGYDENNTPDPAMITFIY